MAFKVALIRLWLVAILSLVGTVEAFSVTKPSSRHSVTLLATEQESSGPYKHSRREVVSSLVGTAMVMGANILPAFAATNQTDTKANAKPTTSSPAPNTKSSALSSSENASDKSSSNKLDNPGDVKNCPDFKDYKEAKAWYDKYFPLYGDVARLDGDKNGIPCESLPGAPPKKK